MMNLYRKKAEYLFEREPGGIFLEIKKIGDVRRVYIKHITKEGGGLLFKKMYENDISPGHLKFFALDFLYDCLEEI